MTRSKANLWIALSGALSACVAGETVSPSGAPVAKVASVVTAIESFNAGLSTANRTAKYCKMVESPFAFFRGTNHLFWSDLAGDPRFFEFGSAQTRTWLQGDLHADNFGSFDDDDAQVVYDLNDFDETVIADYQWDVWRMAVSLVLIAEQNGGFSATAIDGLLDLFSESYLDTIASYRGTDQELGRQFTRTNTYGLLDDFLAQVENENTRLSMLDEWTVLAGGVRIFDLAHPELDPVSASVRSQVVSQMSSYAATTAGNLASIPGYFKVKDVAVRLDAGLGSLGTPRYYVLIEGATSGQSNDRILDVKRQGEPSAYPYLSAQERALLSQAAVHHAARTVEGYRALVTDADDHLGTMTLSDGVYSVRERSPFKDTFPTADLDTETRFGNLAEQWGAILATAHARADKDFRADLISYSLDAKVDDLTDGFHGEFRALVREIAHEYGQQVQADDAAFASYVATSYVCP
jgi:uncharacterized protein (DUF2252 family)